MPVDAVWIVVTIPKETFEKTLNVNVRKPQIRYEDSPSPFLGQSTNQLNNNLRNSNISLNDGKPQTLEKVLDEALKDLGVSSPVWISSKDDSLFHVYFPVDLYDNDETLNYLQSKGIGVKKHSSIGYIPFGLYFQNEHDSSDEGLEEDDDDDVFDPAPGEGKLRKFDIKKGDKKNGLHAFKKLQEEFLKSVTSRLTVAQVVTGVRESAELTFDFLMYTIFAGCIAAAGLLNNSAVDVAAAMMIEPVMATVMAITFGLVIRDHDLTRTGIRSCIVSLIICLVVGYLYGVILFFWKTEWNPPPSGYWPTGEMSTRGQFRTLVYGTLQALAAGGAIAVTLLNDNQAALVGVAVASTFLPPFINTGLLWAYATHITVQGHYQNLEPYVTSDNKTLMMKKAWLPMPGYTPIHYLDQRWEFMSLSGVSMIYTFVNIICMLATAYIFLRVKEVMPLGSLEPNRRFFAKDIKVAREYNRRMTMAASAGQPPSSNLGDQILSEWADIAGLDAGTLLSDRPEAEVTRRQTLHDIIADVHKDDTYLSVTRQAVGVKNSGTDTFLRRLTNGSIYRRQSINPLGAQQIFDIESNVLGVPGSLSAGNRGRFFITNKGRRGSKWVPSGAPSASPTMSVSSQTNVSGGRKPLSSTGSAGRGLRPEELGNIRRQSALLQKSLKEAEHSPFSLWPSGRNDSGQTTASFDPSGPDVRRRKSTVSFSRRTSRIPNVSPKSPRAKGTINESFESES